MNVESVRQYCLSLPHATEKVQWGANLVFKIAGKMFAVMSLEPSANVLSFKCTPESFYELQEIEGMVPAPYMARAQWLAMRSFAALRDDELRDLLATSYRLVYEKLTKKQKVELEKGLQPNKTEAAKKQKLSAPKKKLASYTRVKERPARKKHHAD